MKKTAALLTCTAVVLTPAVLNANTWPKQVTRAKVDVIQYSDNNGNDEWDAGEETGIGGTWFEVNDGSVTGGVQMFHSWQGGWSYKDPLGNTSGWVYGP